MKERCGKCGLLLPIENFTIRRASKGNRQSCCKVCVGKYNIAHRKDKRRKMKDYYAKNQERILMRMIEYQFNHRKEKGKYNKDYYLQNKEKFLEYSREGRKLHPDKYKKYRQIRNHRIRVGGELLMKTIQRVYEANIKFYGTLTCYLCLKPIEFGQDSLEHKVPVSRGGTNLYENLAIAHRKCNGEKGTKTYEELRGESNNE